MSDTATYDGKVGEVIEVLKGMTALELSDLKKAIEEVFDVTAAAPMAMMAPAAGGGEAEEAGEKDSFVVKLSGFGEKKIQVIKAVRSLLGLGLKEAKEFVDKAAAEPLKTEEGASTTRMHKLRKSGRSGGRLRWSFWTPAQSMYGERRFSTLESPEFDRRRSRVRRRSSLIPATNSRPALTRVEPHG